MLAEISTTVPRPVSAKVAALEYDGMVAEGETLAKIASNIVICRVFA